MTPETKQKIVEALWSGRLYAKDYAHTAAERYGHNSKECERAWSEVANIEAALEALEKEDINTTMLEALKSFMEPKAFEYGDFREAYAKAAVAIAKAEGREP